MAGIVNEAYRVAKREKIHLDPRNGEKYVQLLFRRLIPATYDHHPSMLQDLMRKRRTEIDSLNGAIARLGNHCGVDTPINHFLTLLIKARGSFNSL